MVEVMEFGGGFSVLAVCFEEIDLILFDKCGNEMLILLKLMDLNL